MMLVFCLFQLLALQEPVLGFTSLVSSRQQQQTALYSEATITKLDGRKIRGDIKPLNNFLLVKTVDAIEATEGGILLTGKAKIKKTEGTVVAVGPGKTHQDSGITVTMPVNVGDGVVYGKYDGTAIDLNGKPHTLIRDDDILVKYVGEQLSLETVDVVHDTVLVYVENTDVATEGGILIAKSSSKDKKPSTGEVMKVGRGKIASNGERIPMDVQPGDMVKFRDFAGNEVEIDGKEYSVVRMVDILAKF